VSIRQQPFGAVVQYVGIYSYGAYLVAFEITDLADFCWNDFFNAQVEAEEFTETFPAKVLEVHRGWIRVSHPSFDKMVPAFVTELDDEQTAATVGDWLLLNRETELPQRLLRRNSLFKRRAPGTDNKIQLIAANIDTLFIVSSCNKDFNKARLERYLALAAEANVTPVLVLTKADLTDDPQEYAKEAVGLLPGLVVEIVNSKDEESAGVLSVWCQHGQSVALIGSSGVGKSTLIKTLVGDEKIETQGIREDDAKGRHTTTGRTFYRLPTGGWLLDTPGMRGLELTDATVGVDEVFSDILELAQGCKFSDCAHDTEPGCAIRAALESGVLEASRVKRWQKLEAGDTRAGSPVERHSRDRALGKMIRQAKKDKKKKRKNK